MTDSPPPPPDLELAFEPRPDPVSPAAASPAGSAAALGDPLGAAPLSADLVERPKPPAVISGQGPAAAAEPIRLAEVRAFANYGLAPDDLAGSVAYFLRVRARRAELFRELSALRAEAAAGRAFSGEVAPPPRTRREQLLEQALDAFDPLAHDRGRRAALAAAALVVVVLLAVLATFLRTRMAGR